MKTKIKYLILLFLGMLVFNWVYEVFSGEKAISIIIENKDLLYLLIIAHIPTLYFDAMTWVILSKNPKLSLLWSLIIVWISQATGKFFPTGNITGEFVRIYLAVKKGLSTAEATSTVFIDLVIATFSLFLIAIMSFIYFLFGSNDDLLIKHVIYLSLSLLLIFISCVIFYFFISKRILKLFIKKIPSFFAYKIPPQKISSIIRIDRALYQAIKKKAILIKALIFRILGWLGGAFEIYVFLWVIGYDPNIIDVIVIESFSGIIRAVAFFIPAGIGVQELAFIIVGDFVGLNSETSFSIALGRRVREILVGLPAITSWFFLKKKLKHN